MEGAYYYNVLLVNLVAISDVAVSVENVELKKPFIRSKIDQDRQQIWSI